jgi:hypothetical protein
MLAFVSGELENLQIHLVRDCTGVSLTKHVIGEAKIAAREHLFAITIVGKCAGFSY